MNDLKCSQYANITTHIAIWLLDLKKKNAARNENIDTRIVISARSGVFKTGVRGSPGGRKLVTGGPRKTVKTFFLISI